MKRSIAYYRTERGAKRYAGELMRVWGRLRIASAIAAQHPHEFGYSVIVYPSSGPSKGRPIFVAPRPKHFGKESAA